MKFFLTCEIEQFPEGKYTAKLIIRGRGVEGLPEKVGYSALRRAIQTRSGIELPLRSAVTFSNINGRDMAVLYVSASGPGRMKLMSKRELAEYFAGHEEREGVILFTNLANIYDSYLQAYFTGKKVVLFAFVDQPSFCRSLEQATVINYLRESGFEFDVSDFRYDNFFLEVHSAEQGLEIVNHHRNRHIGVAYWDGKFIADNSDDFQNEED